MSPRAAARLEAIGLPEVLDYVAGKVDWGAAGLPLAGTIGVRAGDSADASVPTCRLDERISVIRTRLAASGWETCVVTNAVGIVLGQVGRHALRQGDGRASAQEVMTEGPSTVRPSLPLADLLGRMEQQRLTVVLVTTSDGRLRGAVRRDGSSVG